MNDNDLIKAINSDFHRRIKFEQNKAIREFAERLKAKRGLYGEIWESDIDNTVEEMTEEADEPHN